jgi:hypothetical protein
MIIAESSLIINTKFIRALRNASQQIQPKRALRKFLDSVRDFSADGSSRELLASEAGICRSMSLLESFFVTFFADKESKNCTLLPKKR